MLAYWPSAWLRQAERNETKHLYPDFRRMLRRGEARIRAEVARNEESRPRR